MSLKMLLISPNFPIQDFSIFKHLTSEELKMITLDCNKVQFKKGETIFKQGTSADHVVCLYSGLAKKYLESNQNEFIIQIYKPMEMIGFQVVMGAVTYPYSLSAIEPVTAYLIKTKVIYEIAINNKHFCFDFMKNLSIKEMHLIKRTAGIVQKQMNGRVADFLLFLHRDIYSSANPFPLILSRQDIADMTSMTKESSIRILKKFKEGNIIKVTDKTVEILNLHQLEKINEYG